MKQLDKKDKRILYELYKDGRASITALSSRVGVSKEAFSYRLKRLEKEGILTKISAIIDVSALGYRIFRVQILLTPEGKKKREEVIEKLKSIPKVSWIVRLSGNWDYAILFVSKTTHKFQLMYDQFISEMGKYIDKKISSVVFSINHLPPTSIIGGERIELKQELKELSFELDENQKKILNLLEENARMPLLQIARKINTSITTVKYHLNILEKKKVILAYKPILRFQAMGYEQYKVMLELADPSNKAALNELLRKNPSVIYITDALGKYDLEYECLYNNVNALLEDLNKLEEQVHIKKFDIIFTNEELMVRGIPDV